MNSAAINNRYLMFVQTRGLITLVSDNHVDSCRKEILAFVYHGSIVNNRSQKALEKDTKNNQEVLWNYIHTEP